MPTSLPVPPSLELLWDDEAILEEIERRLSALDEPRRQHLLAELRRMFPPPAAPSAGATSEVTVPHAHSAADGNCPTIPGYENLEKLKSGGMGVVYRASQTEPRRVVALKLLLAGRDASEAERQRFRFEAEAVADLHHPNIVPIYQVGEASGEIYLSMRYLESGSLKDRLPQQKYPPVEAAGLVAQVARAVQYAHDHGILHRDLKPGNIFLDADDRPYLGDFGLARRLDAEQTLTPEGGIVGTLAYMAPEQARAQKSITIQADVFGLGAILYELLTGAPPRKGETAQETLLQLVEDWAIAPPRQNNRAVHADLDAVCMKCLATNPADRYASARELAEDLERYRRGEGVEARPPGFWDWLVQVWRTRPPMAPHTWSAPVWFGAILFAQHAAISAFVATEQPLGTVWATSVGSWLLLALVHWWMLLRRFREVPAGERHSIMNATGSLLAQIALFLAFVPLNLDESARSVLPVYPALMVVAGFSFFMLGSTHWGELLVIGVVTMALAVTMAAWPWVGPPLYGVVLSNSLIWWGLAKWWYFVRPGVSASHRE